MAGDVASVVLDEAMLVRLGLAGSLPELITTVERIINRPDDEVVGGEAPARAAPVH